MSEVRALIEELVSHGLDPVDAAEIVTRAAITGAKEATRSAGAKRQQRYRDRNKASLTVTGDAGDDVSALPSKEGPQTPKETQPSPSTHKENPLRGQKKASRLPADWVLPDEWRQDALDAGLRPDRIDLEADKLRDWSRSSKNGAKLDWRATWRNWCREAASRGQPRGSPARPDSPLDVADRLLNELRFANGHSDPPSDSNSQALVAFPGRAYAGQR